MKLTENELFELKYHYVDRVVDNMSTKDLVSYVFDDLLNYVHNQPDAEFLDEARELNRLTFKLDQIVIKERNKLL